MLLHVYLILKLELYSYIAVVLMLFMEPVDGYSTTISQKGEKKKQGEKIVSVYVCVLEAGISVLANKNEQLLIKGIWYSHAGITFHS